MARIPLLDFSDRDISGVFIARNTAERERVEALFNADGIEYAIEVESFVLLPSSGIENMGLAFYVPQECAFRCYELCEANGLDAGIIEED
ncbi:MAG: hypothetical protein ACM3U2_09115 [Deltaproteobacteria bacterium]